MVNIHKLKKSAKRLTRMINGINREDYPDFYDKLTRAKSLLLRRIKTLKATRDKSKGKRKFRKVKGGHPR